ncbi:Leucine carboxyl methyltransferase [Chitinophaga terrae (ex Kim and Jung 2007)]|uniref:Leucine carboxyl methyltransferase n=1 Tax=Chitinophaga terrae (ex Kim and Jung 2007) TaxID=408074 RepID=A0A1H3XAN5_9BACT|nr:class I SAM-dependent methyltransferase [Chitinophaga terrae (ex Kim and Jung 2007)]GEP89823.1 hypothetical protein CTE07_14680 [Chitinophaga terrae (ex Kim and Jung 2007)]SDZ96457.1 Leucine carboxyl methyltransferase [Chitinophaga terrae (ex Kim and Jung 2007)]
MTEKLKVRATSKLILEAALPLYHSTLQQQYINAIDFSETNRFFYELKRRYPQIIEIVLLRKFGIRHFISERMNAHPVQQAIILGAGLDPLSLYLLENYPQLRKIIEVDNGDIAEKKAIYDRILPQQTLIHFAPCDITDTPLLRSFLAHSGYAPGQPAIIVFEGIIHYIPSSAFLDVMQLFRTPGHHNQVMLDYCLAGEDVPLACRPLHEGVLDILAANLPAPLKVYSRRQINAFLQELHAASVEREPLPLTEKKRGLKPVQFKADGEGIIELLNFYI